MVTLTNVVSSAVAGGQAIMFSINNFNSPPTNQAVDGVTVSTFTSTGGAIDSCTAYVTGLVPKVIASNQFAI